jgi:hypothetical protein
LSSGEVEYYGVVKAGGVGLGYQSLLRDLGIALPLRVWTDSTATIGICARDGLGKLRHIDTQCLWLQQKVRSGAIELRKVKGTENPADLFTKHLANANTVEALLKLFSLEYRGGRAETAPRLREGAGTGAGSKLAVAQVCFEHGLRRDAETLLGGASVGGGGLVEVEGHYFEATTCTELDGALVPEAKSYLQVCLPHQVGSRLRELFPRAVAAPAQSDKDLDGGRACWLEKEGGRLATQRSEVQSSRR